MSGSLPTLTDLISRLEEHRRDGIDAVEYRVDELLAVLRWNNTPEALAQNRSAKSFQDLLEYIEVLGPEDSEAALSLLLKATRIHLNAELVETWLASVDKNGSER
jgi:hypothetical protein